MPNVTDLDDAPNKDDDETRESVLFAAADGLHGRSEGIYLDMEERKAGEIIRAQREKREPVGLEPGEEHLLGPVVGTQLKPKAWLGEGFYSYPSNLVDGTAEKESDPLIEQDVPVAKDNPIDLSIASMEARERRQQEDSLTGGKTDDNNDSQSKNPVGPKADNPKTGKAKDGSKDNEGLFE